MGRSLAVLAVLLAGALAWAYLVVHPPGGGGTPGEVAVWELAPRDVARVTFKEGETTVVLEPTWEEGADAPYVWVRTARPVPPPERGGPTAPAKRGDPAAEGAEETDAEEDGAGGELKEQAFKGNVQAVRAIRDFSALTARRALGALAALPAEEYGLTEPVGVIEVLRVSAGAAPFRLQLGRATFGDGMRYVATGAPPQVFLLSEREIKRLRNGSRALFDRELLPFPVERAAWLRVELGSEYLELWRLPAEGGPPRWAPALDEEEEPELSTLITRLGGLRVLSYEEGAAGGIPAVPVLVVRAREALEEAPAALRLFQGDDAKAVTAESTHTRRRVRVSSTVTRRLLEQVRKLLKAR